MECSPVNIFPYILFFTFTAGSFSAYSIEDSVNRMHYLEQPLRFDEIDSSPLHTINSEGFPFPLLFPAEISLISLIDFADPGFQSLEKLSKLPVINNFTTRNNRNNIFTPKKRPTNRLAKDSRDSSLMISDPVSQFLKSAPSKTLPTDAELTRFLYPGDKYKPTPENIPDLPNSNIQSSQTFSDFRNQAESALLNRIFKSEPSPDKTLPPLSETEIIDIPSPPAGNLSEGAFSSTVKLRAQKPNNDGQLEPAQASEFYLTTQNLQELLQNLDAGSAVAGELQSVAEIWAKAEKNASQSPEVALGVKSIMLQAKVSKARTDPYGKAALRGVQPDEKYFLIGIDKDVQSNVVTIWSKELDVQPGENLVELSSSDVIYQE